jgi:ligand-binding sensor domain-containing protein
MTLKKHLIFLCSLIIVAISSRAQGYWESIDLYTTKNGLPNNSILSILQDKRGFLWLGTYNGLCRYDGSEFISFSGGSDETPLINSIQSISQDTSGNIWVATRTGMIAMLEYETKNGLGKEK